MFSQFFVQIFALYNFFCKNLRKKRRKFSMDPICYGKVVMTSISISVGKVRDLGSGQG